MVKNVRPPIPAGGGGYGHLPTPLDHC